MTVENTPAETGKSEPVVAAKGLSKTFGEGSEQVEALRGIDLTIQPGEFISLIGPSGCGKSTLLRLIGDLLAPTSGALTVNGKDPATARGDRDYGMVFQRATLLDWRTVSKNVELPLEVMGSSSDERTAVAARMLDLVQLGEFGEHYPWQLSGGMQQRVAIARALTFQPRLLLMDEPFGALDEMTREQMQQEVLRIWRETETSIVFVTHSIPEAVFLSSRVIVMSARPGQISDEIDTGLPYPRDDDTRESQEFFDRITEVREALRRQERGAGPATEATQP
ncbi:MAG: ABC transporter ATP-binding protein [Acidimicrobiia bacterium]